MTMSITLQKYLAQRSIAYVVVPHRHTETSMNSASSAHVPADQIAKPVILEDENSYLMAVIPANQHVKIGRLNKLLGRKFRLATEAEVKDLFTDCEPGAIPPVGEAYGLETIVDNRLTSIPDVYLEAGDHEDLLHLMGVSYRRLMKGIQQGSIC